MRCLRSRSRWAHSPMLGVTGPDVYKRQALLFLPCASIRAKTALLPIGIWCIWGAGLWVARRSCSRKRRRCRPKGASARRTWEFIRTTTSVSYTHLDVYKRQIFGSIVRNFGSGIESHFRSEKLSDIIAWAFYTVGWTGCARRANFEDAV